MAVDMRVGAQTAVLKALAEPARWRIVERLADEALCVCHLVDELDLAQPLVSHHLKVLRAVGLVESERFRQWTYYRIRPHVLASVAADMARMAECAATDGQRRRPCC